MSTAQSLDNALIGHHHHHRILINMQEQDRARTGLKST